MIVKSDNLFFKGYLIFILNELFWGWKYSLSYMVNRIEESERFIGREEKKKKGEWIVCVLCTI